METFKVVAHAAILHNNQVLILLRKSDDECFPGIWETPGGTVEKNESIKVACAREVMQETGINTIIATHPYHCFEYTDNMGNRKLCLHFLVELEFTETPKIGCEHDKYQWILCSKSTKAIC